MPQPIEPHSPDAVVVRTSFLAENLVLRVGTIAAGVATLVFVVAWLVNLRYDVNTISKDILQIKVSVQAMSKVVELEAKINEIRQYGSDLSRKSDIAMTDLRKAFDLHVATTTTTKAIEK